jgi:predicted RNA-binding protein (virulence factor B family)
MSINLAFFVSSEFQITTNSQKKVVLGEGIMVIAYFDDIRCMLAAKKMHSIDELRFLVAPVAEKYGVGKVYLFGSAREVTVTRTATMTSASNWERYADSCLVGSSWTSKMP